MTSILDQYVDDKLETISEEPEQVEEKKEIKKKKQTIKKDVNNTEIEEKREELSILAVLGTIENYTGVKMSLGDVKRLPAKDIEKYYNRYQVTMGEKISGGLVDQALETGVQLASCILPIDDNQGLCNDLKNNDLVKQELTSAVGYLVLKGGRFVALASCLIQIAKHISFNTIKEETKKTQMIWIRI